MSSPQWLVGVPRLWPRSVDCGGSGGVVRRGRGRCCWLWWYRSPSATRFGLVPHQADCSGKQGGR